MTKHAASKCLQRYRKEKNFRVITILKITKKTYTHIHMILLMICSLFYYERKCIPVCPGAFLRTKQTRGERTLFSIQLQDRVIEAGAHASSHIHNQETRECIHPCLLARIFLSYIVQNPMPRECRHPQRTGSSHTNYQSRDSPEDKHTDQPYPDQKIPH